MFMLKINFHKIKKNIQQSKWKLNMPKANYWQVTFHVFKLIFNFISYLKYIASYWNGKINRNMHLSRLVSYYSVRCNLLCCNKILCWQWNFKTTKNFQPQNNLEKILNSKICNVITQRTNMVCGSMSVKMTNSWYYERKIDTQKSTTPYFKY